MQNRTMKSVRFFPVLSLILSVLILSCSKDELETVNESQSYVSKSKSEVDSLAVVFENQIMKSVEYRDFEVARHEVASRIKVRVDASIETREKFLNWVGENFSSTTFNDISEAGEFWDLVYFRANSLMTKYSSFYSELGKCSESEILTIMSPVFQADLVNLQDLTPCETGCMNDMTEQMAATSNQFAATVQGTSNPAVMVAAFIRWDVRRELIMMGFNLCYEGCST